MIGMVADPNLRIAQNRDQADTVERLVRSWRRQPGHFHQYGINIDRLSELIGSGARLCDARRGYLRAVAADVSRR
jgi:hypothetical protein